MNLALGTAQFGSIYGVTNSLGQTPAEEVGAMLRLGAGRGLDTIDTARAYGEGASETVLGEQLRAQGLADAFRIVTKLRAGQDAKASWEESRVALEGVPVDALLVHHAPDLLGEGGDALWTAMTTLGARRLGSSVYTVEHALALLERYPLEVLQLPMNVLDQRGRESELFELCASRGVEVHVRSVFLQGLLLATPEGLEKISPGLRERARGPLAQLAEFAETHGFSSRIAMCLCYVYQALEGIVGRAVCGAENAAQLTELIEASAEAERMAAAGAYPWQTLRSDDLKLVDPREWPKL